MRCASEPTRLALHRSSAIRWVHKVRNQIVYKTVPSSIRLYPKLRGAWTAPEKCPSIVRAYTSGLTIAVMMALRNRVCFKMVSRD